MSPPPLSTSTSNPQPSITVYRGLDIPAGQYVWSAFVNKLECRLRFGALDYRVEPGNFLKAPRGKIPWIALTDPTLAGGSANSSAETLISDSALISRDLVQRGLLRDLNEGLTPVEKAQDLAIRALVEDKLYFYQVGDVFIIANGSKVLRLI